MMWKTLSRSFFSFFSKDCLLKRTVKINLRQQNEMWFRNDKRSWFELFCINVLKCGLIPKHVAFIMDGNRRFARQRSRETLFGHMEGFNTLTKTLSWCHSLGINEVTVYVFSIENFKRSKDEVKAFLDLMRERIKELLKEKLAIMERGVCIRFFGNLSLLPQDMQRLVAEVTMLSKNNNKGYLNICIAYTSREEITSAMKELTEGVTKGLIQPSDVTESLLEKCLYTSNSVPPDLVIRTSGEVRLSDFLLWQSAYSVLVFVKFLWPEFTIWQLFLAVLKYQMHFNGVQRYKEKSLQLGEELQQMTAYEGTIEEFVWNSPVSSADDNNNLEENAQAWISARDSRVKKFLAHLQKKREKYISDLLIT